MGARKRITLLLLIVLAISGITYLARLNIREFEEVFTSQVQRDLLMTARYAAQYIEEFIGASSLDLEEMSKNPIVIRSIKDNIPCKDVIQDSDYSPLDALYGHLKSKISAVYKIDKDGIVQERAPFKEGKRGQDYSEKPGVGFVLEHHNPFISGIFKTSSGEDAISICYPVFDGGEFIGVVRTLFRLTTISDLIQHLEVGGRNYLQVISADGTIISHPDSAQIGRNIIAYRTERFPHYGWSGLEGIVERMTRGEEGTGTYYSVWWGDKTGEMVKKLTAFVPVRVGDRQWSMGIVMDYADIVRPIKKHTREVFVFAEFLILIFLAAGTFLYGTQRKRMKFEFTARTTEALREVNQKLLVEIASRTKAEDELRKANMLNQTLLETIPFGMDIVDEGGNVLFLSRNLEVLFGKDVIGRKKCWELYRDDKRQCADCPLIKGIKLGETASAETGGVFGGKIFQITHTGMMYKGKKSILEIFQDITERKRSEKELIDIRDELEAQAWGLKKTNDAIKLIYKELEQKNRELQRLDQLKSDFVSTVSHELRTPLAITKEGINLVLDGITGGVNEKQKKVLSTAKGNLERLANIINDLLDISKIESGKMKLNKELVNMNDLVQEIAYSFEPMLKERHLELKTSLPGGDVKVYADPDKIIQVITNLMGNALKFTKEGHIEISVKDSKDEVECAVSDTGMGISKDDLLKVFGKFTQFSRKPGAGEKGTGLGLAISKGIVEMHEGRIWVDSELGKGTKFIFTIPKKSELDYLKEVLGSRIEEVSSSGEFLTLLFIDIANLGGLKEKLAGEGLDRLLSAVNRIISSIMRRSDDAIISIADNRIAVIYKTAKSDGIMAVVDRLKVSLSKRLFLKEGIEAEVALCMGLATYGRETDNIEKMIEGAGRIYKKFTMPVAGKREIVVVDDDEGICESIKLNLEEKKGFRVHTYSGVSGAIDDIVRLKPELIITDIHMPGVNGYELVGRLHEYDGCEEIPVIFITAYGFDDKQLNMFKSRRIIKLSKPFNIEELSEKVDLALKGGQV